MGILKIGTFSLSQAEGRHHPAAYSSREAIRPLGVAVAFMVVLSSTDARAMTLFRYEDQARLHCLADTVVWLDFKKRKYYLSGQKLYGSGHHGSFVCLKEARRDLYRRSLLGRH